MATKISKSGNASSGEKISSRDALLRSASELMTERGTIEISLSDIAKHSGLNSALVKYYFGTKQGMMLALIEDVLGRGLIQLEGLLSMPLDPIEKLKLHVKAIITVYFRYPYINRLIHYLFEDPEAGQEVARTISTPLAETQRALLEEGIAAGLFKPIEPMLFYFIVLGACDHLFFGQHMLRVAFGVDTIDDDLRRRYTNTLLDLILNGVLATPETSRAA
ncbi:TetR family transcriptional regulator [Sphingosinithalassobacter portus]|uniref:TetR family transcriptional regulator n=1 Tax=Stakelama portus TaxID=2676234 RepID=UPI0023D84263|nr:TetR family transcriptional regulator [Sphingosinithalassobacter portus]